MCEADKELPELSFVSDGHKLVNVLSGADEKRISEEFSKSLGRQVIFVRAREIQTVTDLPSFRSYWEIAEFLAGEGYITINGLPFVTWKGKRDTLLHGGEYRICANDVSAQIILDEINFVTEKNFRIVAGDPKAKAKVLIEGNGLTEVLASLATSRNIRISEQETNGN